MEGGRGGGGGAGRTPRGKKNRGSPRGRGQGQASPGSGSPAHQASTVASSTTPSSPSTPQVSGGGRDEEPKVSASTHSLSTPTPPATAVAPVPTPPSVQVTDTTDETTEKSKAKEENLPTVTQASKDDVDKKMESTESSVHSELAISSTESVDKKLVSPPVPPAVTTPSSPATKKEDLELAEPQAPPPLSQPEKAKVSTEAKVETALAQQQPWASAKTLVVTPGKEERSTGAPLSVEIDPACITSGETSPQKQHSRPPSRSRSGSVSPGYAYALHGPVGKPGYIGGVGFSEDEVDTSGGRPALHKRESAIAAVETAVKGFSKRQWILLIIFGLIDFLSAITISLQAPFYPAEAERKGATATEYGFVFGIFEFIVFLTSPIFGRYMNKLGPKTVFSVCILISSVSVICFGLLDRINDHTWFITLCFVCRIFEALGCGGFFTATFVIIACEFPETVATTFASLETFFGLGLIVGPTVGGALFDVGGFPLPFFVVGGSLLVTGLASGLVMPKIDKATDEDGVEEKGYGILTILKIPSVALAALSIAATSMSLGFVSATLEPHIRRFALTPLQTGLVFICNGGVYALTAPLWGYICDYIRRPIYITILGNFFIFISFTIIGPADFMPFDTILWVTIVGLLIQGLGFGCCLVSGFIVGLKDSMTYGQLPDSMATYAVASGLWTSAISLGAWVGPSVGGILYDYVGFREGSWLILVTSLVVGITILIHTCTTSAAKSDGELEPLIRPISPLLGGKPGLEESCAVKPTTYGTTSGGDEAV